jgi:hypothetical protein
MDMGPRELARIERLNGLFAAVLIVAAVVFFDQQVVVGAAVGAGLAVINFYGMRKLVVASLRRQGMQRALLQLLLILKMGVLFVLVFLAIRFLPLHPVALAVGLSIFLLSIAVESLRHALGHDGPEAHDGRA